MAATAPWLWGSPLAAERARAPPPASLRGDVLTPSALGLRSSFRHRVPLSLTRHRGPHSRGSVPPSLTVFRYPSHGIPVPRTGGLAPLCRSSPGAIFVATEPHTHPGRRSPSAALEPSCHCRKGRALPKTLRGIGKTCLGMGSVWGGGGNPASGCRFPMDVMTSVCSQTFFFPKDVHELFPDF